MAPVYLNPPSSAFPLVELKEEQQLPLSLSPHQASTSLSGPTFFSTTDQDQREQTLWGTHQHDQAEVDEYNLSLGRSCDHKKVFPSSSFQSALVNHDDTSNAHKVSSSCKREDEAERSGTDGSLKWMQKLMLNSNSSSEADHKPVKFTLKFQGQHKEVSSSSKNNNNNNNSSIRVCSDCNTTSTPLWRSGPRGPKSLCNACGIRQRKARRAMVAAAAAAAANGTAIAIEASSSSCAKTDKVYNKEKKSRTSHVSQCKKLCKLPHDQSQKKQLCNFKNLAPSLSKNSALQLGVLPQDVEEAAILLMELSCGFI